MSWARLDDAMPVSRKIADLSDAAFRAYVTSICFSAQNLTDGVMPYRTAFQIAGRSKVVKELSPDPWHELPNLCPECVRLTTLADTEVPETGFYVHDYLVYNPCRKAVLAEREERHVQKVEAGRIGAAKRWQKNSTAIAEVIAEPMAEGIAEAKQNDGPVPLPRSSSSPEELQTQQPRRRERRRDLEEPDIAECRDMFPSLDVDRQAVKYLDWCRAKGEPHKDKVAGFRNWLRTEEDNAKARRNWAGSNTNGGNADKYSQAGERLRARM